LIHREAPDVKMRAGPDSAGELSFYYIECPVTSESEMYSLLYSIGEAKSGYNIR
jgi:hypothetical protein